MSARFHLGYASDWIVIAKQFNIVPNGARYDVAGHYFVNTVANAWYGYAKQTGADNFFVGHGQYESGQVRNPAWEITQGAPLDPLQLIGTPGAFVTALVWTDPYLYSDLVLSYDPTTYDLILQSVVQFAFSMFACSRFYAAAFELVAGCVEGKSAVRAYPSIFQGSMTTFDVDTGVVGAAVWAYPFDDNPGEYIFLNVGDLVANYQSLNGFQPPVITAALVSGAVQISFGQSGEDIPPDYLIERSQDLRVWADVPNPDNTVVAGQIYFYRVQATLNNIPGGYSNVVKVST